MRAVEIAQSSSAQDMGQQGLPHRPPPEDLHREPPKGGALSLSRVLFKYLGNPRGGLPFGLRKARAVRFNAGAKGEGHADGCHVEGEELHQRQREEVLGSRRGSISFGLPALKVVRFRPGESTDSKASTDDGSILEKRSRVLGSRRGSVSLSRTEEPKSVRFQEASQRGDGEDSSEDAEAEQGSSRRSSLSEKRAELLGSRRGSITLGLGRVKMVRFDGADVSSKEDNDITAARRSISGQRSAVLGSRRGSVSLPRQKAKAVQFAVDPVGTGPWDVAASSVGEDGSRSKIAGLRLLVLGSRRGSVSVKREDASIPKILGRDPEAPRGTIAA